MTKATGEGPGVSKIYIKSCTIFKTPYIYLITLAELHLNLGRGIVLAEVWRGGVCGGEAAVVQGRGTGDDYLRPRHYRRRVRQAGDGGVCAAILQVQGQLATLAQVLSTQ